MEASGVGGGKSQKTYEELVNENNKLRDTLSRMRTVDDETIWMESGVGFSGNGFVHLFWGEKTCQLDLEAAVQHGLNIIECAHAAEYDAVFIRGMTGAIGISDADARGLLGAMRQERGVEDGDASARKME